VTLQGRRELGYDVLIIATGCRTAPEETEGMLGPKWRVNVHDFYTLDGAKALREKLAHFTAAVSSSISMRCRSSARSLRSSSPSSPTPFSAKRGMRDKVTLTYVTPLSGAFTKPKASKNSATC
jgi:sulfide:quinone oxidoreductase